MRRYCSQWVNAGNPKVGGAPGTCAAKFFNASRCSRFRQCYAAMFHPPRHRYAWALNALRESLEEMAHGATYRCICATSTGISRRRSKSTTLAPTCRASPTTLATMLQRGTQHMGACRRLDIIVETREITVHRPCGPVRVRMETGSQIGPFVVQRLLGKGGMGSVYLAEHSLMKDLHAIKILDPQLTQNPAIVTRFVNEARAAAKLRHRNLVRVHNIERLPNDGPWFMVLDYLDGTTLARFMAAQRGPMPPTAILHILAQVANCIQHVHDHKIVHRDLKPDNIFLIQHGEDPQFPVVLDLGVAQLSEDLASGPATKTGTVIGTPIYMAPEQLRGERVSPSADIFALGIIAYEMTTGGFFPYQYDEPRAAYFELAPAEIYYRQRTSPPVDPRQRCPGLGDAWASVLRAALDLDPRARPPSAGAFARMLAAALPAGHGDGHTILHHVARELTQARGSDVDLRGSGPVPVLGDASAEASPGLAAEAPPISTLAGAASQSVEASRGRRRWTLIVAAGFAALVAGGTTFAVTHLMGGPPAAGQIGSTPSRDGAGPPRPPSAANAPRVVTSPVSAPPTAANAPRVAAAPAVSAPPDAAHRIPAGPVASSAAPAVTLADAAQPAAEPAHPVAPPAVPPQPTAHVAPRTLQDAKPAASGPAHAAAPPPSPDEPAPPPGAALRPPPPPRPPSMGGAPGSVSAPPPPAASASKKGELAIIVKPWALIWLNGKAYGQTPFRESIAAGRYRLRLTNDDAGKDETTFITVGADQTTTIQRSW